MKNRQAEEKYFTEGPGDPFVTKKRKTESKPMLRPEDNIPEEDEEVPFDSFHPKRDYEVTTEDRELIQKYERSEGAMRGNDNNVLEIKATDQLALDWKTLQDMKTLKNSLHGNVKISEPSKTQRTKNHITSLAYDVFNAQGNGLGNKIEQNMGKGRTASKYGW